MSYTWAVSIGDYWLEKVCSAQTEGLYWLEYGGYVLAEAGYWLEKVCSALAEGLYWQEYSGSGGTESTYWQEYGGYVLAEGTYWQKYGGSAGTEGTYFGEFVGAKSIFALKKKGEFHIRPTFNHPVPTGHPSLGGE